MKSNTFLLFELFLVYSLIHFSSCENNCEDPEIKVESIPTTYTGNLYDIYFADQTSGIIVGEFDFNNRKSVMLRTIDGGNTWRIDTFNIKNLRVNNIGGFGDQIFINVTNMDSGDRLTYRSVDLGLSWHYYFTGLTSIPSFFEENNGIALLGLTILVSSNGGEHWDSTFTISAMAQAYMNIVGSQVTYIACGAHHDIVDFGILLKSIDKGKTWTDLHWNNSDITNMYFLNDTIGYLFTFSGKLIKTRDGGDSFTLINEGINDLSPGCFFISELEGFYSSQNAIYWTNDGGKTWEIIFKDNSIIMNNKIVYNGNAFIIGSNGLIIKINKLLP